MWFLPLLLLLPPLAAQDVTTQPTSMPTTMQGEMRVELEAMVETRYWFNIAPNERMRKPELRVRFKVSGARLGEVARVANTIVFDEFVDDTGKSLLPEKGYSEEDRKGTRLVTARDGVEQNGLLLMAALEPSTRGATTVKKMRGSIRVVYGSKVEQVTIENPLQFSGKLIQNPKLEELGVAIRILPPGDPANLPPGGTFVAYEVMTGSEKLRDVGLYDAWMKRMRGMPREMQSTDGKPCTVLQIEGELNDKSQMVIEVFPQVEDATLPIEMVDVKLP